MATLPAEPADHHPHVPARAVLLSAAALWFTYFLLITLRGAVTYQGEFAELLWRRALVTLAGIAVTLLAWPVLRRFDGRSNGVRIAAALVIMLPAAVALAAINQQAFAPVERKMIEREAKAVQAQAEAAVKAIRAQQGVAPGAMPPMPDVRTRHDVSGNMLIDVADPPMPDFPPEPPEPPAAPAPPEPPALPASSSKELPPQLASVVIHKMAEDQGLWKQLTDVALGRYFLLIAWAGLYLALGNAEMARASERREGEYKRAAKAAELRSLRYQVNPHFLFNTLNSLSALVMVGRTEQAEKMIQTISSFYRHSLAGDPSADVRLADEIALQRHYLEIEAVRFPERLACEFDVPESLESACVPGMILQPLVENSIKYGVSASTRPVTLRIAAQEAGGRLVLTVADDGPGKTSANGGTGIGLENVRSRLAARFGDEARVESGPLPAGGYATVLTIPLVRAACEQGGHDAHADR
ncbi:histidine kinase [Novosphingobium sp. PASSN1]|uniref:sensor histidine kinase n=1 Tax=Novosphingobium sp. PASSN1 TaxID=2015561 RepID=UPI000BCAF8D6|nr:histidine kinase [Novosphingobium sp. PASSN1]OYU36503.1 MAG: sensor histidine kinase [Novosphingobium sp. PASSN1]